METVLNELTNLGSAGVTQAIDGYARWYLVSALCWLIVGIVIICCGNKIRKHKLAKDVFIDANVWNDFVRFIASGIVILIGLLMVIHNLSTICAPEAYAIHKFILDIKP